LTIRAEDRDLRESLPSARRIVVDGHPGFRRSPGELLAGDGFEVVGEALGVGEGLLASHGDPQIARAGLERLLE
jgi:hypothetical protein